MVEKPWQPGRTAADSLNASQLRQSHDVSRSESGLFVRVAPMGEWPLEADHPEMMAWAERITSQARLVIANYRTLKELREREAAANLKASQEFVEAARQALERRRKAELEAEQARARAASQRQLDEQLKELDKARLAKLYPVTQTIAVWISTTPQETLDAIAARLTEYGRQHLERSAKAKAAAARRAEERAAEQAERARRRADRNNEVCYKPTRRYSLDTLDVDRNWMDMAQLASGPDNAARRAFFEVIEQHLRRANELTLSEWMTWRGRYGEDWTRVFPYPQHFDHLLPGYKERMATRSGKLYGGRAWVLYDQLMMDLYVPHHSRSERVKKIADGVPAAAIDAEARVAMRRSIDDDRFDIDDHGLLPVEFRDCIMHTLELEHDIPVLFDER